jgi:hypothetical protein
MYTNHTQYQPAMLGEVMRGLDWRDVQGALRILKEHAYPYRDGYPGVLEYYE